MGNFSRSKLLEMQHQSPVRNVESEEKSLTSLTSMTKAKGERCMLEGQEDNSNQVCPIALEHRRLSQEPEENLGEAIRKAMLDNHGNNKGYFTRSDFIFFMQMTPNERWTENEAEQTLYALLQEGKIQEIEPGRYAPST